VQKGIRRGKLGRKRKSGRERGGFWQGNFRGSGGIQEIRQEKKSFGVSEAKEPENERRLVGHSSDGLSDRGTL